MRRSIMLLVFLLLAAGTAGPGTVESYLRTLDRTGSQTVAGDAICATGPLREFYRRRGDSPAWTDANAAALLGVLQRTEEDGLDSAPYHEGAIAKASGAERDILLTDAFLLYGAHLLQGRVDPQTLDSAWCIAPRMMDLAAVLQAALDDGNVTQSLSRLAPRNDGYMALRTALARYREIAARGGWPAVSPGPSMRIGQRSARVAELARRLDRQTDTFDEDLAQRVRGFQSHHGLDADGVAGNATLRELNVSAAARVEQVAANMERWRWMPAPPDDPHVMVNIAAFQLKVVDREQTVMTMKTIVGKLYTSTPFFAAQIRAIVFNPYWNVPDKIADEELWPKQRRDRRYLSREHFEVVGGQIRQVPGPWNALGRIKFDMPNRFLVYLHDTPARSLFAHDTRAFSHGCIRVERPRDLAVWLLRNEKGWSPAAIDAAIDRGKTRTVSISTPVPVYVLYWTAFVAEDGDLEFRRDIYDQDRVLIAALRQSQAVRVRLTAAP